MDFKKFSFTCPSCSQILNDKDEIELITKRKTGEDGKIYMSVAVGNYMYRHVPLTAFEPNEVVEFYCPHCAQNLASEEYENFALLNMKVGKNINFEVIFSREAGQRKTYVITEDGIETYQG